MYYFGSNLENQFSVPDFWPKPEQSHKIPHDWEDIDKEIARLKQRRLAARDRRLEMEKLNASSDDMASGDSESSNTNPGILDAVKMKEAELREGSGSMRWFR
jgi:protein PET100, fungi type